MKQFLLLSLILHSCAAAQSSRPAADVADGNRQSDALFAKLAVRRDVGEAAQAAIPQGFTSVAAFGAQGNGQADDTAAIQRAIDQTRRVWLERAGVYRISRRLNLGDGCAILSDGSATILLAGGDDGFSNQSWAEDDSGLFSPRGTGIRIVGKGVRLAHFFLVKEYEDDRYVIGVEIVSPASDVMLDHVCLRGFSLAPGIISIKSAADVVVRNCVIHASSTQSTLGMLVNGKANARYQITGILVDDQRPAGHSRRILIENNVITDLRMKHVGRGDQTDGVNLCQNASDSPDNIVVRDNAISDVAEGIDSFARNVRMEGNVISAREQGIKLIHGARQTIIERNTLRGPWQIGGIVLWPGSTEDRQVRDIVVQGNLIEIPDDKPGVLIRIDGPSPPVNIRVHGNQFKVSDSARPIVGPCEETGTVRTTP